MSLEGKRVLITGAARRVGRALALAVAAAGGDLTSTTANRSLSRERP